MSIRNCMLRNPVELNYSDIPVIMEFRRDTVMVANTEEDLRQRDLEQIAFLKQKLKNVSQ